MRFTPGNRIHISGLAIVLIILAGGCGMPENSGETIFQAALSPVHLEPTRLIRPGTAGDHDRYCRRGWGTPEGAAAWMTDRVARCIIHVPVAGEYHGDITVRALADLEPPQTLSLLTEDRTVAEMTLSGRFETYAFTLPADSLHAGWNVLSFACSRIDSPASLGLGGDRRRLTAFVKAIHLVPPGTPPEFQPESDCPPVRCSAGPDAKEISPGGLLRLIRTGGDPFRMACGIEPAGNESAVRIIADRDAENGGTPVVLADVTRKIPRAGRRVSFSVNPAGQAPVRIRIINRGPAVCRVSGTISRPPDSPVHDHAVAVETPVPRSDWYFLVVPDALAPRFTGAYGNPDARTPFMDRLAASGTTWSNAVSTAAYTVTAVAGMLSGEYPGRHGVTRIGDRLNSRIPLLSTRFVRRGYRAFAVSGMPTVSSQWGFNRDFDTFDELAQNSPEPVSGKDLLHHAIASLDEYLRNPALVYLHFREPHSPYQPPAPYNRFRRFVDPASGSIAALKALDRRGRRADPAAVAAARALYTGQVAAVDHYLESWHTHLLDRIPDNRDFVFMVISDHGEAFGEHGRFEHNSTVYDDMTRVTAIRATRHRTAGVIRPEVVSTRSLHAMLIAPDAVIPEAAWSRAAGNDLYATALRLENWKYIVGGYYHAPELYDCGSDPGETRNLAARFPVTTDWLDTIIRRVSGRPSPKETEPEQAIDENTRNRLNALGYLN